MVCIGFECISNHICEILSHNSYTCFVHMNIILKLTTEIHNSLRQIFQEDIILFAAFCTILLTVESGQELVEETTLFMEGNLVEIAWLEQFSRLCVLRQQSNVTESVAPAVFAELQVRTKQQEATGDSSKFKVSAVT